MCYAAKRAIGDEVGDKKWLKQSWWNGDELSWGEDEKDGICGARGNLPLSFVVARKMSIIRNEVET